MVNAFGYGIAKELNRRFQNSLSNSSPTAFRFRFHNGVLVADPSLLAIDALRDVWIQPGAQSAMLALLDISISAGVEYGMAFYRAANGEIINSPPVSGHWNYVDISYFTSAIATMHTHPNRTTPYGETMGYGPSIDDLTAVQDTGIPAMIVNWDGTVFGIQ